VPIALQKLVSEIPAIRCNSPLKSSAGALPFGLAGLLVFAVASSAAASQPSMVRAGSAARQRSSREFLVQ